MTATTGECFQFFSCTVLLACDIYLSNSKPCVPCVKLDPTFHVLKWFHLLFWTKTSMSTVYYDDNKKNLMYIIPDLFLSLLLCRLCLSHKLYKHLMTKFPLFCVSVFLRASFSDCRNMVQLQNTKKPHLHEQRCKCACSPYHPLEGTMQEAI